MSVLRTISQFCVRFANTVQILCPFCKKSANPVSALRKVRKSCVHQGVNWETWATLGDQGRPGALWPLKSGATLTPNANLTKKHTYHDVFLKVRAPGDVIYYNLCGPRPAGIVRPGPGPYTKPPGLLQAWCWGKTHTFCAVFLPEACCGATKHKFEQKKRKRTHTHTHTYT